MRSESPNHRSRLEEHDRLQAPDPNGVTLGERIVNWLHGVRGQAQIDRRSLPRPSDHAQVPSGLKCCLVRCERVRASTMC